MYSELEGSLTTAILLGDATGGPAPSSNVIEMALTTRNRADDS